MKPASSIFFAWDRSASNSRAPSSTLVQLKSSSSKVNLPASIFEKSRMSLITVSSASPLERIVWARSRCSLVSEVSSRRSVIPITPFIGVRISWLIFARNSLFARFADSAAILA